MSVVLVTGATSRQGGAVADHLLAAGFPARAFMRDPRKPRARELAQRGAELASGDLDDPVKPRGQEVRLTKGERDGNMDVRLEPGEVRQIGDPRIR
jgi:NAD(P)-dependent dehydrogenase (short-subunit alcohol dehydrogenase family)